VRRLRRNLFYRLRAVFLWVRQIDRIDLHIWAGLLLIGVGAARLDLEGACLLVGSLVLMLGVLGARNAR
jgi:hypothetical protein